MKKWYLSKTLWFNVFSILLIVVQYYNDVHIIPLEMQAPIMAIINILLRAVTILPITQRRNKNVNQ